MAPLKTKGDLAELKVACDLVERGYRVAIPFGEDHDFDIVFWRDAGDLQRVQVKHVTSDGSVIVIQCRSLSLTNGKVKRIKRYTAETIDWIAAYDRTSRRCYYVPASELGTGRDVFCLRLVPTRNGQRIGVHYAEDYLHPRLERSLRFEVGMEPAGLEPAPSCVQGRRSPN